VLSFARVEGGKHRCDAYLADERLEPGMPPWVTLLWTDTCRACRGSAKCEVHAPQAQNTMAWRACAAGNALRSLGATVRPIWTAPALSGHHRLSVRYRASEACPLTGMDRRDQHVTSLTLSPFQTRYQGTPSRCAYVSLQHRRIACGGRTNGSDDVPSPQEDRRGPLTFIHFLLEVFYMVG